jgi:hypothetical protein
MTVNEMHIAVNLGVQKLASFQADTLLPQEIDFELNLAMNRFIKQRYNAASNRYGKGFEQSQKRIDDLRTLLQENTQPTFQELNINGAFDALGSYMYTTSSTNIYVDTYTMPLDYLFLVSVKAFVQYTCNSLISPYLTTQQITPQYAKVSLSPPAPGYELVGININFGFGFIPLVNYPLGYTITKDIYTSDAYYFYGIKPAENPPLLDEYLTAAWGATTDSNSFYVVNPDSTVQSMVAFGAVQTVWAINGNMAAPVYLYSEPTSNTSILRRSAINAPENRISPCIYVQHDDVLSILKDPFNTTGYDLLLYTVQENQIDIYTDNTFVVPQVTIRYIRKPKVITIGTAVPGSAVGCELPEHTHAEIVEMTIKSILEGIESQRYQSQSMENLESE